MDDIRLPGTVLSRVEMAPFEDVGLAVLRDAFPDVRVVSAIPLNAEVENEFFILVRRASGWGQWDGDDRFVDEGSLSVQVFARDPDGDERAARVSEAVRVALRDAWRTGRPKYYPQVGSLIRVDVQTEPLRKTDWATSSGPVQYADLQDGWFRYEATYTLRVRRPLPAWDAKYVS